MSETSFFDRMISKLDKLDANSIQGYILRLVREKGFLETVFNTIQEGILVIDGNLKIRFANQAAKDLLGFPKNWRDQRISRFIRDVDWQWGASENDEEWRRMSLREIEVFYPKHRVLSFYLVPHPSEDGAATVILNDITEKRQTDLQNIESRTIELVSTLAAGVAHEIGNPLNSLNIHLQLLERHFRDAPDEEASELLTIAKSEVSRLDTIINQFLRAIRPSKPTMSELDLKELLLETFAFIAKELESRSIKVKCHWDSSIPTIMGDANQLKQAFYNIIKNAIQAMPEGGELETRCEVDDKTARLSFADTGKGIDPEHLSDIINPYFTTKEEGTGLGLMIVERVVREHGATLEVESAPGKGAVFTIVFPRRHAQTRLLSPPAPVDELGLYRANDAAASANDIEES